MARRPTRLTREQQRIVRELVRKHAPAIEAAFMASIRSAQAGLDFAGLVRSIERGDILAALDMLRINQATLFPLEEAIRTAFVAGGASVTIPKGIQGAFSFNGRHIRAERIIAETGARLVTEIGSPGEAAIRSLILQGQQEGIGAQKIARRLAGVVNPRTGIREGGIMGLDGPRAERSARVREILSDPDQIQDYFRGKKPRFTSTDRRFDAQVRRAIREGRALDKTTVERIAKLHDARLLKARGRTIAEHEAYTAQAQGRREAYSQLLESGQVESIDKKWQHATAKNPRHDHQALDGKTVPFNEPFVMADGTRMQMPHDPDAPAHHTIGCRCSVIHVVQYRRPGQ